MSCRCGCALRRKRTRRRPARRASPPPPGRARCRRRRARGSRSGGPLRPYGSPVARKYRDEIPHARSTVLLAAMPDPCRLCRQVARRRSAGLEDTSCRRGSGCGEPDREFVVASDHKTVRPFRRVAEVGRDVGCAVEEHSQDGACLDAGEGCSDAVVDAAAE